MKTGEDAGDAEFLVLAIEEAGFRFCFRNRTGVVTSEEAVAVARDDAVSPVSNRTRDEFEKARSQPPELGPRPGLCGHGRSLPVQTLFGRMKLGCLGKLFQREDHSIRPSENPFARKLRIDHDIHRIEILRILPMAPENA